MNIKEIYEQLAKCNFVDEVGNPIGNNISFIELKEISELNYNPKYQLNQKVVYVGKIMYISSIRCASGTYPDTEVEYALSDYNRYGKINEAQTGWIREEFINTENEYMQIRLESAKKLLKENGFKIEKLKQ